MKILRALIFLVLALALMPAHAGNHGSISSIVGQTVMNLSTPSNAFTNIAHGIAQSSSTAGWPGTLSSDGYPTSSTTATLSSNNLPWMPNYNGRYHAYYAGSGAFQFASPAIVYSGGTATQINSASGSVTGNFAIGFAGASTQPSSSTPVEFSVGALVNAIADAGTCSGGTAGLVCLTSSLSGGFSGFLTSGLSVAVNNVTNLSGVYAYTKLDSNHIQLLGSIYSGSMSINSGAPGVQSEAIIYTPGNATWTFPAQGTLSTNYSGFGGLVICRSQNTPVSDCAAIANSNQQVNPDFVASIKADNPRWVRLMDWLNVQDSKSTNYTYRTLLSNLSWNDHNPVLAYWGATVTNGGSDNYTVSNPTASPSTGAYQDGEVIVGQISGANTGYKPTLQISGRTGAVAAPILTSNAGLLSEYLTGTVPTVGSLQSCVFTGGGLASPHTLNYTTVSNDNSINNLIIDLTAAMGADTTLTGTNIFAVNSSIASTSVSFSFLFNPNINSSGVAALGNGMTVACTDASGNTIYNQAWEAPGYLPNNSYQSFTWCQLCQAWITNSNTSTSSAGGVTGSSPPVEFFTELATRANVGLWYNIGLFYSSPSITSLATNICQSGVRETVVELSNEEWNSSEAEWAPAQSLGTMMGFSFQSNGATDGFYGLRVGQIAALLRAAWSAAGCSQSTLFITDAYQFVNASGSVTNRFNGGNINPASNVTLAAYGGYGVTSVSTNYSAFPNRPVDWADFVSPAPYFQGVQFNSSFGMNLTTSGLTVSAYNCSLVASYNYANGNSTQQQAALDFMFNGTSGDFYSTTPLPGKSIGLNLGSYAHGSGTSGADYFGITSIVEAYDSQRTGTNPHTGLPWKVLGVAGYEGDAEAGPVDAPSVSAIATSLTTLGDTSGYTSGLSGSNCGMTVAGGGPTSSASSDAANMLTLLTAFKNDNRYKLLYLQYFNDFQTAVNSQGARLAAPATFGFESAGYWGKYPGTFYTTPYQSLNAIKQFNFR